MTLKTKTLFITDVSRGIGLAIAKRAAADGANVLIAAKTTAPNPKLPGTIYAAATEIEAARSRALPRGADIREEGAAVAKAVGNSCVTAVADYLYSGRADRPEAPCRN